MEDTITHTMLMTMMSAISAGIILTVLARRINVSAIALLLIGGVLLGPEGLGLVRSDQLGSGLPVIVSLAIGLILFEGGLTLDLRGYRSASGIIRRLLTFGVLITWGITATLIWVVFRFDPFFCLLAASLVIVTGPTVIAPLLKRIKVQANLHSILHWEGVLIDAVGVFVAIMCYEWIGGYGRDMALVRFLMRFAWGLGLGVGGGLAVYQLIRRRVVPDDMINAFALGAATLVFGCAEAWFSESGLLAVTVAGFVLGIKKPGELKEIRQFKAEISDLLIGTLFLLLAARLELSQFVEFGLQGALVVLGVMLVVRPLNIVVSSWGLGFSWREKAFLAWVAPRGIVAASMASLFTLSLTDRGFENAAFIETFTYSVIVATVLIQGFSAGALARVLKLQRPKPTGWLIVGAHSLGRRLAGFILETSRHPVVLIDTNPQAVSEACSEGFEALHEDARDVELESHDAVQAMGYLVALTDNEDLNMLLCQHWADVLGRNHVFYWQSYINKTSKIGQSIWPNLPKPSVVSGELERGEAVLMHLTDPKRDDRNPARHLASVQNGRVTLQENTSDASKNRQVLLLRREADYLAASLRPNLVVRLDTTDQDAVFVDLVDRMAALVPKFPRDAVLNSLRTRERTFPSALGHGLAVPHTYCADLDFRLCAIAQIPGGLDFGAMDGQPVRLMFLLVGPVDDPEGHLKTIAEIARLTGNAEMRDRLLAAEVPDGVLSLIRDSASVL